MNTSPLTTGVQNVFALLSTKTEQTGNPALSGYDAHQNIVFYESPLIQCDVTSCSLL